MWTVDGKDHFSTWDVENLYNISYQRCYANSLFLTLLVCYNSVSEIYENEKWALEMV